VVSLLFGVFFFGGCETVESDLGPEVAEELVEATWQEEGAQAGMAPEGAVAIDRFSAEDTQWTECIPDCTNLDCGTDGCGGTCGECGSGAFCVDNMGICADFEIEEGTCMGIIPCMDDCLDDSACRQECAAEVPPEVQETYQALNGCLEETCQSCPENTLPWQCNALCAIDSCDEQWVDCLGGNLDCGAIVTCISQCTPSDDGCKYGCILHGKLLGQQMWLELYSCIVGHCGNPPSQDCSVQSMRGGPCSMLINQCKTEH
jgi:hypothetical protein